MPPIIDNLTAQFVQYNKAYEKCMRRPKYATTRLWNKNANIV